jgi:hypothetical protein
MAGQPFGFGREWERLAGFSSTYPRSMGAVSAGTRFHFLCAFPALMCRANLCRPSEAAANCGLGPPNIRLRFTIRELQ